MAHARPLLLCALGIVLGAACELVVSEGQTTVLADGSSVLGVTVDGGTLIVEDANVAGRGVVAEAGDAVPPTLGPAVVADGGVVRILGGTLVGGNLLILSQDPNTPASPPVPPIRIERRLPSALVADGSSVEISGGTLVSGGQSARTVGLFFTNPALRVTGGALTIRGGNLLLGNELLGPQRLQSVVIAQQSRVAIGGGRFGGWVRLAGSRSLITQGRLEGLALGPPRPSAVGQGCTQLQGGSLLTALIESADETLLILGTGFNHPLGRVPITSVAPGSTPSARVTGVLADGTPLDLDVFATTLPANVLLAPSGTASCAGL